ncbi:MAG: NifU family protein [Planctomycetota bacterium]|nr:NifU family protein [Planctomycetota bacterium]
MKEKVESVLNRVRPMLQADGGNVELVSVDEKTGVVKVKLTGACGCCPMAQMTLKAGIEATLKKEVPEVKQVVSA